MRSAEYPREWEFRMNEFHQANICRVTERSCSGDAHRLRSERSTPSADRGVARAVLFCVRGKYVGHREVLPRVRVLAGDVLRELRRGDHREVLRGVRHAGVDVRCRNPATGDTHSAGGGASRHFSSVR
jgi:hypothetical protein